MSTKPLNPEDATALVRGNFAIGFYLGTIAKDDPESFRKLHSEWTQSADRLDDIRRLAIHSPTLD